MTLVISGFTVDAMLFLILNTNTKTGLDPLFCLVCCLQFNLENVPFTRCDNSELSNINYSNSMRFLESLPNVEIVNEARKFKNISSNDASFELPSKSSAKYYMFRELQLLNISSNFNIFHTETSEKEDTGFLSNVEMDGYQKFHTASKSSKGGLLFMVPFN